jgi:hypothetical protein
MYTPVIKGTLNYMCLTSHSDTASDVILGDRILLNGEKLLGPK